MPRARILLRVSTDRQAKAATVDAQRPPVRKLVQGLGATDIVEYIEEAVSGAAPLDERDVMRRLLAEAEAGDIVAAFDMSRLTRSDDWIERYGVLGHLRRARVRAATVDDGEIDFGSIGGRITMHIRGEIAADERGKIRSRMLAGKANAAAKGRKPQGATPYGYHYDRTSKVWSIVEAAAAIVREIFQRILGGETTGVIAADLNRRGVLVPKWGKSPEGPRWTSRRVWHLATRTTYRGEWTFQGHVIAVPVIVDAATWQAVQAQLLAAGRRGLRRTQHVYLLDEALGRCDYCRGELRIRWGGPDGQTHYYTCPNRGCGLGWKRTDRVDDDVWQRILAALRRPDLLEHALQGGEEADGDARAGEAQALDFERRLDRLAKVEAAILARFRRDLISEDGLEREVQTIARERTLLQQSAQAAREEAALARASAATVRGLREAIAKVASELEGAAPAERRDVVRGLRPDIRLRRDRPLITFRLRAPSASTAAAVIAMVPATCSCTTDHCETENALEIAVVA